MHNEELGTGRIRSHGSCHGKNAGAVFQIIGEAVLAELSPDAVARASGSGSFRAAALNHKALDDTVETKPVVITALNQADKIIHRIRGDFRIKLRLHNITVFHFKSYNWVLSHNILPLFDVMMKCLTFSQ